jgi:hypothetical protein
MNCYFVFEGKTEQIVYRKWFSVLLPHLTKVESYDAVDTNNYYYEGNMGVPDCYNTIAIAIQEINEVPKYDYLVLFTDADRFTVAEKEAEAYQKIGEQLSNMPFKKLPDNCKLEIVVQKVCIETWFLGNRRFFEGYSQYNEDLKQYIAYFDVSKNDPEELASEFEQDPRNSKEIFGYKTKAQFHKGYLRATFKEWNANNLSQIIYYDKKRVTTVTEAYYLEQLRERIKINPTHLRSFQAFIDFCLKIAK